MVTQETFVFHVVEVIPESQAAAQGAMIVSLQESFPGVSVDGIILIIYFTESTRVKLESVYRMFYRAPALTSSLLGYGSHVATCLMVPLSQLRPSARGALLPNSEPKQALPSLSCVCRDFVAEME